MEPLTFTCQNKKGKMEFQDGKKVWNPNATCGRYLEQIDSFHNQTLRPRCHSCMCFWEIKIHNKEITMDVIDKDDINFRNRARVKILGFISKRN